MPRKKISVMEEKYGAVLGASDEDDEVAEDKPQRNTKWKPPERNQNQELEKALKDLLLRLASRDIDDLKQLTNMPSKLIDPIAKGMAYYAATLPTLEKEYIALLDWYIKQVETEYALLTLKVNTAGVDNTERLSTPQAPIRTFWQKAWGIKVFAPPPLQPFDIDERLQELARLSNELRAERDTLGSIDTEESYFIKWAYNFFMNRRSAPVSEQDNNLLKMLVMLTDGQIVNQQQQGMGFDPSRILSR